MSNLRRGSFSVYSRGDKERGSDSEDSWIRDLDGVGNQTISGQEELAVNKTGKVSKKAWENSLLCELAQCRDSFEMCRCLEKPASAI